MLINNKYPLQKLYSQRTCQRIYDDRFLCQQWCSDNNIVNLKLLPKDFRKAIITSISKLENN